MNWVVDIGNTTTKMAVFKDGRLVEHHRYGDDSVSAMAAMEVPASCIVSATRTWPKPLETVINAVSEVIILDENTPLPFKNHYTTPHTLGRDRIAGVAGALGMFPGKPVLVIDAGTSITYDLGDAQGNYYGGSISPGLEMRYRALNEYTGKLPLVEHKPFDSDFGNSTESAIRSGVFNGLVHEVNGTIRNFNQKYPDLVVVLCGGDADYLVNHLNYRIFALPNLVLLGLHQILTYNAN